MLFEVPLRNYNFRYYEAHSSVECWPVTDFCNDQFNCSMEYLVNPAIKVVHKCLLLTVYHSRVRSFIVELPEKLEIPSLLDVY